jgi:hypothetical protein
LLGGIVATKASRTLQLRYGRVEYAILMIRRAEEPQARMWFLAEPFLNGFCNARLSDTRLPGNQDDAPFACFCLRPAAYQKLNFFISTDQWRCRCAQRLEAAFH